MAALRHAARLLIPLLLRRRRFRYALFSDDALLPFDAAATPCFADADA